jgi:hypothetical protein
VIDLTIRFAYNQKSKTFPNTGNVISVSNVNSAELGNILTIMILKMGFI